MKMKTPKIKENTLLFIRTICIVLAITVMFSACDDKNVISPRTKPSSILVTVYDANFLPVNGAVVFTSPATKQGITDASGNFLFSNMKLGVFEVYAELEGYGSGKTTVEVKVASSHHIYIYLQYGKPLPVLPEIEVLLPTLPANFSLGEKIAFSFKITDLKSAHNEIDVVVSSNLDGVLLETKPNSSNNVNFETSTLSRGKHTISITATNKDNYSRTKTIEVSTVAPSEIILESATKTGQGVLLQWQKYTKNDFKRYEVYRTENPLNQGQMLASFSDADTIQYLDKLPLLVSETYYYVRIINTEDQFRNSNQIKVIEPAGKVWNYRISDAVHHPTEPIIYIIDSTTTRLIAIDYVNQTELYSRNLEGRIGKIDIGDNGFGVEIYVPNNSGFIHAYSANNLSLQTSIITGLNTISVATNGNGYIAASVSPSPWWEQPLRTYSRSTGSKIDGNGHRVGGIRLIPKTDNIISISTGTSPTKMEYSELNSSGEILSFKESSYHGHHPLNANIFRASNSGEFVVTSNQGAIYDANSGMLYKGMIDRGNLEFSDFAFGNDDNIFYAGTSNRNSIQIVRYPQLTRSDEILVKGFPKFIFFFNGEIISVSRTAQNAHTYIFERVSVE